MQQYTGEIKSLAEIDTLTSEEREKYTPLSDVEYSKVKDLPPKQRVITLNDIRHQDKQIAKRRAANKRNKQSQKRKR